MKLPHRIKLDIDQEYYNLIPAQQGDTARVLNFQILNNNIPFSLENKTVRARIKKPDGNVCYNDMEIINASEGECDLKLTNQILIKPGMCKVQLEIMENGEILSTIIFAIFIRESIDIKDAAESTNEFTALENGIIKLDEWDKYFKETSGAIEEKYTERLNGINSSLEESTQEINKVKTEYAKKTEVSELTKDKATINYVNDSVARLSSGTPLFASSVSGMTDISKNYVNTTDGFLYTYNGIEFVKSSIQYQSTGINDKSVTFDKLSYLDNFIVYANAPITATVGEGYAITLSTEANVWYKRLDNNLWKSFPSLNGLIIQNNEMVIGNIETNSISIVSTDEIFDKRKVKILFVNSYGILFGSLAEFANNTDIKSKINSVNDRVSSVDNRLKELEKVNKTIPSYYSNEIVRVRNKVASDITSAKCSVFAFITDQQSSFNEDKSHNMLENYTNVNYLADYIPYSFIANGGDFISGYSSKENVIEELKQYAKLTFETTRVPYMITRGNHDDNSQYTLSNGRQYTDLITPLEWYKNVIKYAERFHQFVWDNDNREGGYCYIEDENAKIRYIFLNAYDTPAIRNADGTHKYNCMENPAFSDKQVQWIAHKALNFLNKDKPNEWAVIAFCHYLHGASKNYTHIINIIDSFKKGTKYEGSTNIEDFSSNVSVDFTEQGQGEFITVISGDTHEDRGFHILNDIVPIITRTSSLPDGWLGISRPIGTDQQDAFDIMVVDRENKLIKTTRFGCGEDVIFNYESYTPKYTP